MKKLKWMVPALMALAVVAAITLTGCGKTEKAEETKKPEQAEAKPHNHATDHGQTAAKQFTCSMHPDVVQDKAGACPKCGMALTEKH